MAWLCGRSPKTIFTTEDTEEDKSRKQLVGEQLANDFTLNRAWCFTRSAGLQMISCLTFLLCLLCVLCG